MDLYEVASWICVDSHVCFFFRTFTRVNPLLSITYSFTLVFFAHNNWNLMMTFKCFRDGPTFILQRPLFVCLRSLIYVNPNMLIVIYVSSITFDIYIYNYLRRVVVVTAFINCQFIAYQYWDFFSKVLIFMKRKNFKKIGVLHTYWCI